MPGCFDDEDREVYRAIAKRAQSESVHTYTVLCLGLQSYLASRKLCAASE